MKYYHSTVHNAIIPMDSIQLYLPCKVAIIKVVACNRSCKELLDLTHKM